MASGPHIEHKRAFFGAYPAADGFALRLNPDKAVLEELEAEAKNWVRKHSSDRVLAIAVLGDRQCGVSFIVDWLIAFSDALTEARPMHPMPASTPPGARTSVFLAPHLLGYNRSGVVLDVQRAHAAATTSAYRAATTAAVDEMRRAAFLIADVLVFVRNESFADESWIDEILALADPASDHRPALFVIQNQCANATPREDIREFKDITARITARMEGDAGSRWPELCKRFLSVTFAMLPHFGRMAGPADARYDSTFEGVTGMRTLLQFMDTLPITRQNYQTWLDATRRVIEDHSLVIAAE